MAPKIAQKKAACPRTKKSFSTPKAKGKAVALSRWPRSAALPEFGTMGIDRVIVPFDTKLEVAAPLNVTVVPYKTKNDTSRCSSGCLTEKKKISYFGTIRCFPGTHRAGPALTTRGSGCPGSQIKYDPAYRKSMKEAGLNVDVHSMISPDFGEWLYGLPKGWTDLRPMPRRGEAPSGRRHTVFDMFSGCAGLGLSLHTAFTCKGYCEWDKSCQAVLRARIADGHLDDAPIHGDIQKVSPKELPDFDLAALGFPCQDISSAGLQRGFKGDRSVLFRDAMNIVREKSPKWVLIENVGALRSPKMGPVWREVLKSLAEGGYSVKWATLCAYNVGSPTTRKRLFILGTRQDVTEPFPVPVFEANFTAFNSPRPPMHTWLLHVKKESAAVSQRLKMLGNIVVPPQSKLAQQILAEL